MNKTNIQQKNQTKHQQYQQRILQVQNQQKEDKKRHNEIINQTYDLPILTSEYTGASGVIMTEMTIDT